MALADGIRHRSPPHRKLTQPQARRGDPARRARQAPAQPDAGQLPDRAASLPARGRAGRDEEQEVLARVQHLLDERIIRQVTPIFDTRALGYSSMLVAAKVDPENPAPRRAGDQRPSRASRTTTCATTNSTCGSRSPPSPTRRLGSTARCRRSPRRPAPSRCASCPRSSSSRSGWTWRWRATRKALSSAAVATEPIELEPQPYDESTSR